MYYPRWSVSILGLVVLPFILKSINLQIIKEHLKQDETENKSNLHARLNRKQINYYIIENKYTIWTTSEQFNT